MGRQFIIFLILVSAFWGAKPVLASPSTETSFIIPIPQPHTAQLNASLRNRTRDSMIYMLTAFINPIEGSLLILENPLSEGRDWGFVTTASVFPEALDSFKLASSADSPSAAFQVLKNLLSSTTYLKSRELFHIKFPVPDTLKELENSYEFKNWTKEAIGLSLVKGTKRIIYRSPKKSHPISIAQTQMLDGTIRETELIIAREDLSQQFDFYAYNQDGLLTQTSLFHSQQGKEVRAPVPYTCLTCHYNSNERAFQTSPSSYSKPRFNH